MKRTSHSNSTRPHWAGLLALAVSLGGCAGWPGSYVSPASMHERFDSLRDERAVEMDRRLSKAPPPVNNPFSTAAE